jgi:hypothetical protein
VLPLVHQTVSGAPGPRATNQPLSGIQWARSAIIHRTIRCAPDCPVSQRSNDSLHVNGRLHRDEQCRAEVIAEKSERTVLSGAA